MVTCAVRLPAERYRTRASWSTTWLKPLWAKPRNWISATGTHPAMARPMAAPAMTPSDSGVSITRFGPKRPCSPSVARNTPPVRPTSSPKTSIRSSRAISSVSAWFTASTMVSSAIVMPAHAGELTLQPVGRLRVNMREVLKRVGRGLLLRLIPRDAQLLAHTLLDLLQPGRIDHAFRLQVSLHAQQRVAVHPQVVHLARLVARRVVGGRVQAEPVRDRFDQRRAFTRAGALGRVPHDLVHGEEVVAVAPHARKPVGHGLLRERLGGRLLLDRGGDGPAVVLAEEDDRRSHHAREVQRLVEVPLRGAAVTEDREHDTGIPLELQAPGEAGRLRQLARDRGLERQHLQAVRHPERDRVADVPEEREPQRVAVPQLARELAVLRDEPIGLVVERHRRPDGGGLLSDAGRQRHHASLALQAHRALVEA